MRNLPCQNADCLEVNVSASHLSLFLKCGFRGSCLPLLWYLKLSFVCWFTLKMWKIMYVSALRENTRSEWNNVFLPWNSTMKNEQTLIHFWLPTCIPWIYKIKGPHQTKYLCTMIIIQICVEFIWGFMLTNWPNDLILFLTATELLDWVRPPRKLLVFWFFVQKRKKTFLSGQQTRNEDLLCWGHRVALGGTRQRKAVSNADLLIVKRDLHIYLNVVAYSHGLPSEEQWQWKAM